MSQKFVETDTLLEDLEALVLRTITRQPVLRAWREEQAAVLRAMHGDLDTLELHDLLKDGILEHVS
jgi:hypothetical protein